MGSQTDVFNHTFGGECLSNMELSAHSVHRRQHAQGMFLLKFSTASHHLRYNIQMTPNSGEGANCAIEDVAALANLLNEHAATNARLHKLSTKELSTLLDDYGKTRFGRISTIYNVSRLVVRLHGRDTLPLRLIGRYYMPRSGKLPVNVASKIIAGSVALDFLPLPPRSGPGWETFKPKESSPRWWTVVAATSTILIVSMWKFVLEKYRC